MGNPRMANISVGSKKVSQAPVTNTGTQVADTEERTRSRSQEASFMGTPSLNAPSFLLSTETQPAALQDLKLPGMRTSSFFAPLCGCEVLLVSSEGMVPWEKLYRHFKIIFSYFFESPMHKLRLSVLWMQPSLVKAEPCDPSCLPQLTNTGNNDSLQSLGTASKCAKLSQM